MTYSHYYLAANIPQWGIFLGIVCVIIGYIEKKDRWMTAGWMLLIVTGLTSLTFNLFGSLRIQNEGNISASAVSQLRATSLQSIVGGVLAAASFLFQLRKNKYFKILAILTLLYFMLVFFQFNQLMRSESMITKPMNQECGSCCAEISAVPVLPPIATPGILAVCAQP